MDLDYTTPGVLKLSMIPYVKKIIDEIPEELGKCATTPAANHLFQVREESETKPLPEEQGNIFHHTVAQLLFVTTRVRRDIQTAVAFLTTRVKKPDEDDWGKLKRVLRYLKGTTNMKLTLSADNLSIVKWWVDASHAVHDDCKSHTGASMTLGKGMALSMSRKQKINGKSSNESELIGVDDALPQILWTRYFLEAQGHEVKENIIYQDNKSAILLEVNGKGSSSKRTKHMKVRYYFVRDKVESKEVSIKHCPTERMWADVLKKPKLGKAYRTFRSHLMNVEEDYDETGLVSQQDNKEEPKTEQPKTIPKSILRNKKTIQPSTSKLALQECVGTNGKSQVRQWNLHQPIKSTNDRNARKRVNALRKKIKRVAK